LAVRVREARRSGQAVELYFVFAGHGDVDGGRGFLELADGAFTADDLDGLLRRVGADSSHVILDSCNSFFVVNPRKPGGRRFATPRDAAEQLARRLPNVGVFLSTSAEAEVFEWSELQSGVFSHTVRSGLMGGADANRDGRVSYEELAAFVQIAAAEIKNPLYRPKVYARGPNGDDGRTLFDLARTQALALTIDEQAATRLAVRDRDGLRWLDAHKEAGQTLELRVPRSLAGRLQIERLTTDGGVAGRVTARYVLPEIATADGVFRISLADLAPAEPPAGPRGAQEIFRGLFVRPYGPQALASYRDERARTPEPVFGISREDGERMGQLLEQLGAAERQQRRTQGVINLAVGSVFGTYFGMAVGDRSLSAGERTTFLVDGLVLSGLNLAIGTYYLARVSERERTFERFRAELARPGADQARVAAAIEERLQEIEEEEHTKRRRAVIFGFAATGLCAGIIALNEVNQQSHGARLVERGFLLALTGEVLALTLKEVVSTSATGKLIEVWHKDPRLRSLELAVVPTPAGATFGVAGSF
jgi:hypothetical protein